MEIQEIANKYGLPMPETCIKLNWSEYTHFFWVKNEDGLHYLNEWELVAENPYEECYYSVVNNDYPPISWDNQDVIIIGAPQMHEILQGIFKLFEEDNPNGNHEIKILYNSKKDKTLSLDDLAKWYIKLFNNIK